MGDHCFLGLFLLRVVAVGRGRQSLQNSEFRDPSLQGMSHTHFTIFLIFILSILEIYKKLKTITTHSKTTVNCACALLVLVEVGGVAGRQLAHAQAQSFASADVLRVQTPCHVHCPLQRYDCTLPKHRYLCPRLMIVFAQGSCRFSVGQVEHDASSHRQSSGAVRGCCDVV